MRYRPHGVPNLGEIHSGFHECDPETCPGDVSPKDEITLDNMRRAAEAALEETDE